MLYNKDMKKSRYYDPNKYGPNKTELICPICESTFWRYPSALRHHNPKHYYCSAKCSKIGHKQSPPNWAGGKHTYNGYVYVQNNTNMGKSRYIAEHRVVMSEILGRPLMKNEMVHHKNGRKDDNRPENLSVLLRKTHFGEVKCPYCLGRFLIK